VKTVETDPDWNAQFISSLPEIGGGLRSRMVELDPQLATLLLGTQGHNRRIKRDLVERLTRDIKEGRWELNAQPLLIDSEGHLGDGQHRCLAVIKAGKAVPVVVTFGIAPTAFATLDSGRSRTPGDVLYVSGEKSTGYLSRVLNLISLDKHGLMKKNRWSESATNSEREQLLGEHPEIRESVQRCEKGKAVISTGTLAYVHWRGHQIAAQAADDFVDALVTGANLPVDSPAHVLREMLLKNKVNRRKKLQGPVVLAYIIKAFNAFARGETMRKLTLRPSDGFPEFVSPEQLREAAGKREATQVHAVQVGPDQPASGMLG
jgi:hypothetical protein